MPRFAIVDGVAIRFVEVGTSDRVPGQPVVLLESGVGASGVADWTPLLGRISGVAPVMAYDRRGIGESAPDAERPSLRRVTRPLRALLDEIGVAPPYVLVGHSWGGLLTRAFYEQFTDEVVGLVFLARFRVDRAREGRRRSRG